MKKLLSTLLAVSLISSTALSGNSFGYDSQIEEINQFFDSMMKKHLRNAKLTDFTYPRVNVRDTKEKYIYEFDLAGVAKADIKLTINENNLLTLEGKKKSKLTDEKDGYVKQEIYYGSFKRIIQLPQDANQEEVETKYDKGILTLSIPKKETKKLNSKVIPIK
ncbi:Hsp20/alpha crystallin family protein [Sulfurimonas sp. SAG-AH-194-L11]|nr:Hsp20/alpha crystallin family protein [Sulfurimonas sp. SAG-AH-194-L11]MDF1876538.1 Hsp20/alpha crystallin family protein [Sulfurimonas sp. SAG-AH-194-L11]